MKENNVAFKFIENAEAFREAMIGAKIDRVSNVWCAGDGYYYVTWTAFANEKHNEGLRIVCDYID